MARGKQSRGGPAAGHRALRRIRKGTAPEDGSRVPVLVAGAAVDDTRQESVVFVIDLTERKRAEQERDRLRQLQADLAHVNRISMMGELTASLAHDLKQPITAAITDAKTSLRWLGRDQPDVERARKATTRAMNNGARAAEIIDRLRAFYKKDPRRSARGST